MDFVFVTDLKRRGAEAEGVLRSEQGDPIQMLGAVENLSRFDGLRTDCEAACGNGELGGGVPTN